jgi:hypothetical protein
MSKATKDVGGFAEQLESLRWTLKSATDFLQPWDQFHDELMLTEDITGGGKVEDSEQITRMLAASATKLSSQRHEPKEKRYLHLAEHRFWHGMCRIGPFNVIFFYFEDGDIGLAGFSRSMLDDKIDLIRFSAVVLPPGTMPVRSRGQS